ncbi:DNA (cytosine-5)-methyltransferase 1 [Platanthera guangdongensis]|uniref:DNA (Cytosine-5)-methyltransferase 1 n=1 Tax=Platanthera guangdongensis TaxID=2320717 RepID=A0ABR2LPD3_9ASPA
MNYQSMLGIMVAGSYGLPRFRMRVFLWGAQINEVLPQYPLPTHVLVRGGAPVKIVDTYCDGSLCDICICFLGRKLRKMTVASTVENGRCCFNAFTHSQGILLQYLLCCFKPCTLSILFIE